MSLLFKLLRAILNGSAFEVLQVIGLVWLALNMICWVLGAIGTIFAVPLQRILLLKSR